MAIFLARGGRSFTTSPAISTSPEDGFSRPAIIRSKVVFPHPEGPSRTRNSPSLVERSTPPTPAPPQSLFLFFLFFPAPISFPSPPRGPKQGGGLRTSEPPSCG